MLNPPTLATGAAVAMLAAHRRDWVRAHDEAIELRGAARARRRVSVEFELPAMAWAAVAPGAPVLVPLAMRPKDAGSDVEIYDENGARVALLPDGWTAEIATAGLVAVARGAGAEPDDDDLIRLAWMVTDASPEVARKTLEELALGESPGVRRAWMHAPFRDAARALAEHRMLLVALREADRPRTLTYAYDERPEPLPTAEDGRPNLERRLAAWLGWDGLRLRLPLPHLRDSGAHTVEIDSGAADPAVEVDEDAAAATVRVGAEDARAVLWGPVAGLLAALALSAGWLAAPSLDGESSPLLLLLGPPAVLAAYLARRPERGIPPELVRGVRWLLGAVAALALGGEALLASGASTPVLRVGCGILALGAWVVAGLLVETRRRALGGAPPQLRPGAAQPDGERDGRRLDPIRAALLACLMGAGLMIVALADVTARDGGGGAHALFWTGLLVIYVPAVVHAWSAPPRAEAVLGIVLMGVSLYLVKVLGSPLHFTFHDEFSTLRTTVDIERFGTLFEPNPIIDVHPVYPALELVTTAISSVTGLSIFVSATIVIGVLRVALMAALFLAFERAASTRVAALATVLYACNPNFVFFDSQWAYESFALPLALVVVAMAAHGRRPALLAIPIVAVLCVSHPLTTIALIAFLVVWAAIDRWTVRGRPDAEPRRELWILAGVGTACMAVWASLVARSLGGYLGPVLGEAGSSLVDLLLGEAGPKRLFGAAGVADTPLIERLVGFAAVLLALAAVGFGARAVWRRFNPLAGALAAAALVYPLSLPLRLIEDGTEISNRASEFVFVGVALLGALAVSERRGRLVATLVVAAAAISIAGGVIVGTARWARLPGDYLVVADESSVEPEGRLAARWAREEIGPGNRIFTDRANGLLMASIGLQDPQVGEILGRPVPRLFTSPTLDDDVRFILSADKIGYLVADRRIATDLPAVGFYFEREEPGAYRHERPIDIRGLLKYDAICPVGRAFDSGNVIVYDTRRMSLRGECPTVVPRPEAP